MYENAVAIKEKIENRLDHKNLNIQVEEFKDQLPSEDVTKIKAQITEVREKLADKENMTGEEIKKTVSDLQQSSLKLFEMAYKVN